MKRAMPEFAPAIQPLDQNGTGAAFFKGARSMRCLLLAGIVAQMFFAQAVGRQGITSLSKTGTV
jgi:hypothetical protein